MVKGLSITCIILAVVGYILFSALTNAKKEITLLESEKTALNKTIKDYQNAEVEANRTIKKLREKSIDDKKNLDWYNQPVPRDIVDVLCEQHKRTEKN